MFNKSEKKRTKSKQDEDEFRDDTDEQRTSGISETDKNSMDDIDANLGDDFITDEDDNEAIGADDTKKKGKKLERMSSSDSMSSRSSNDSSSGSFLRRISATLSNVDFAHCEPEICVSLLRIPSMHTFSALKKKLKNVDPDWIQGFLEADGLEVLLDCVDNIGSRRVTQLSDAMLLLECVACIKAVMNSKLGLEYIVGHKEHTRKLVKGRLKLTLWAHYMHLC